MNFSRLTGPQIDALCDIAFGGRGYGFHKRTLAKLVDLGLINPVQRSSTDMFGRMTWNEYVMPVHVHIEFCAWCEANEDRFSL